jgi:hypothetical protein
MVLFRPRIVVRGRLWRCQSISTLREAVPKYASAQALDFLARTKNPSFSNRNLAGRGVLIRGFRMDANQVGSLNNAGQVTYRSQIAENLENMKKRDDGGQK